MQNPSINQGDSGDNSLPITVEGDYPTPDQMQQEIWDYMNSIPKGEWGEWNTTCLMNMVTGYGSAVTMQQVQTENIMNQFSNDAQNVWNLFDKGNSPDANNPQTDADFYAALQKLKDEIDNNPFFKDPSHADILKTIDQYLDGIKSTVDGIKCDPGVNSKIYQIWKWFNPGLNPDTKNPLQPANTGPMDEMTRNLTGLTQALMNTSKLMQSLEQTSNSLRGNELTCMTTFVKKFTTFMGYIAQKMGSQG